MSNEFLNSLYKEEKLIFDKILPMYNDFIDIQKLIRRRGGVPKCDLNSDGFGTFTISSFLDEIPETTIANITSKVSHFFENEELYDSNWKWDKKGEFAFKKQGKSTPKDIIDFICLQESIKASDRQGKEKVSGNIYNVISKYAKKGILIRDDSDKELGVQYELNKENLTF